MKQKVETTITFAQNKTKVTSTLPLPLLMHLFVRSNWQWATQPTSSKHVRLEMVLELTWLTKGETMLEKQEFILFKRRQYLPRDHFRHLEVARSSQITLRLVSIGQHSPLVQH